MDRETTADEGMDEREAKDVGGRKEAGGRESQQDTGQGIGKQGRQSGLSEEKEAEY